MSKKRKREGGTEEKGAAIPALSPISRKGWKVIGAGLGCLVLGFIVLSMTDPRGQNWASTVSPFLLIAGYVLIGFGIVTKDTPA